MGFINYNPSIKPKRKKERQTTPSVFSWRGIRRVRKENKKKQKVNSIVLQGGEPRKKKQFLS